jgi:hypothetical protein
MKATLLFFLLNVAVIRLQAAPVRVDLSRSHTIEDLRGSGLLLNEIRGGTDEQDFSFQNQEIEVLLPGGRIIRQFVELGIVDSKKGLLSRFSITGEVMPHEQAVQVAKMFHESFGLSLNQLNEWDAENSQRIRDGEPYSMSANLNFYPRIGVAIKPSMNGLYPWVISLSVSWDWSKHRDWSEERAWRELAAPANAAISLNPPSGLKYDRRKAYKEALEAQAKFEQELAAKGRASTPETNSRPTSLKVTPKPSPTVNAEPQNFVLWPWIIAILLFLAIVSGFMFKFLRK